MQGSGDRAVPLRVSLGLLVSMVVLALGASTLASPAGAQILPGLFGSTTAPPTTKPPGPPPPYPVKTLLASPKGDIATYDAPNGHRIGTTGHWYGYELSMPIVQWSGNSWARVMLPERPNGSTAWVRRADFVLSNIPWRIVIHRDSTSLTVIKAGWPQFTVPVGLGVPKTPTPLGSFYVGVVEPSDDPAYGPFTLDTTGHSEVIKSWQGTGDAVTAIHGPISAKSDKRIGTTGTYISNGCVRMHLADLQRLEVIPPGTPVDIVP